jgi:tetratricopeptide (TPR) repeat protein
MKSKLFLIVSFFLLIFSSVISFKLAQSSHYQTILLYDFNEGTDYYSSEVYLNKIDEDFPNISLTALPIKYLLARYRYGNDSISDIMKMLNSAIKANPYIKAPEAMLARHYYQEQQLDSALFYAKDAFNGLPNNNTHRSIYFKILADLKDSIELDNAFMRIKKYNNSANWIDYIIYRNQINNKPDRRLLNVISDFKLTFPVQVDKRIDNIQNFVEIGSTRYLNSIVLSERADQEFSDGNFKNAVDLYEAAIKLNNYQHVFYENAAIAYYNLDLFDQAIEYFDKVIYDFSTEDGRAEFFKGLMLIKYEDNLNGCRYLKSSSEKNYIGNRSRIKSSDVYISLCL